MTLLLIPVIICDIKLSTSCPGYTAHIPAFALLHPVPPEPLMTSLLSTSMSFASLNVSKTCENS